MRLYELVGVENVYFSLLSFSFSILKYLGFVEKYGFKIYDFFFLQLFRIK